MRKDTRDLMQLNGIQEFKQEATYDDKNHESYNGYPGSNSMDTSNITQFMKFDCNLFDTFIIFYIL